MRSSKKIFTCAFKKNYTCILLMTSVTSNHTLRYFGHRASMFFQKCLTNNAHLSCWFEWQNIFRVLNKQNYFLNNFQTFVFLLEQHDRSLLVCLQKLRLQNKVQVAPMHLNYTHLLVCLVHKLQFQKS